MKHIKRIICTLLLTCLLTPVISNAASVDQITATEANKKVGEGYTKDGVYYEVFEVYTKDVADSDSLKTSNMSIMNDNKRYAKSNVIKKEISRTVSYNAILDANNIPESIAWDEVIDGDHYYGTLYRGTITWLYEKNKTVARYNGTVVCYLTPMD